MTELQTKIDELKQARAAIARLEALQSAKAAELEGLRNQAAQIRVTMGSDILAATLAGDGAQLEGTITGTLATIGARIDAGDAMLKALASKIKDAKQAELHAQAEALRADAAQLRAAAAERQAKTDKLLAQLQEWEGVAYEPAKRLLVPQYAGPAVPQMVDVAESRTQQLLTQAAGLEADAAAIERGQPIPWSPLTGEQYAPLPDYIRTTGQPELTQA